MRKSLYIITGIIILASCSQKYNTKIDANNIVIFPPPPDTTRIQFLTTINNSGDACGEPSAIKKFLFGEQELLPVVKPYGIAVYDSKIYICDTGIGGLEIIDLEKKTFEYFTPGGRGRLLFPLNLAIDNKGRLFVADGNRKQIVVFDRDMNYLDAFGQGEDFKPTGVCYYDNKIFVAYVNSHRIYVYDSNNFSLLYSFPDTQTGSIEHLYQPLNIRADDNGVYVTDFGDPGIKIYSHLGDYRGRIGSYGRDYGQFVRPKGIAVDRESNLYVVDAAFENVQVFNEGKELLTYFGGSYNGRGAMSLPAGICIDYSCLDYFREFVYRDFELKYLIFVSNQFGPDKINVYGFVKSSNN
jgi:DNA-binding beta-propeller fold protein YncE